MNQVAKDVQLLDTAQDCLHFVTGFFEPINVSATHIYHSALELCPSLSIVRRLYYDQCHGIARFPRVVIGTPDSRDPAVSLSGKDKYNACVWSPCGRFIAAQTEERIEIRNQLTLELLAVLLYPELSLTYWSYLAYSPDGRSLACVLPNRLVIWDIQTGGVVQSVRSWMKKLDPVWSFDGRTIAAVFETFVVKAYDVASGAQLFETESEEGILHLWACGESFRILTKSGRKQKISEIGPTGEISLQSSEVKHPPYAYRAPLSNSTRSIYASVTGNTHHLLSYTRDERYGFARILSDGEETGFACLSSDGSHLATSLRIGFSIWKYTSGSFVLFGEYSLSHLPDFDWTQIHLEFSPNSTSILSLHRRILQVWRLDTPPATLKARRQHAAISRSGRHVATARESQTTVTIIDLHSQVPLQRIDTGEQIEGLAITGNVLLVAISEKVVGWLLTEEGRVSNVAENKMADQGNSIWTAILPILPLRRPKPLCFAAKGGVGFVGPEYGTLFIYDTETGDDLGLTYQPQSFGLPWFSFYGTADCREYHYLRHNGTPQDHAPAKDGWLMSHTTPGKEGWVIDPEGRHRFWVPVEWRTLWHNENWHHDITTLFIGTTGQLIMIKF